MMITHNIKVTITKEEYDFIRKTLVYTVEKIGDDLFEYIDWRYEDCPDYHVSEPDVDAVCSCFIWYWNNDRVFESAYIGYLATHDLYTGKEKFELLDPGLEPINVTCKYFNETLCFTCEYYDCRLYSCISQNKDNDILSECKYYKKRTKDE